MKFDDVLKALGAHKGDGTWAVVAKRTGLHYDTVARIARGNMPQPSVQAIEKIADALVALYPELATEPAKAA